MFTDGLRNNTRFENNSPKNMITRPYANASLAPGESQLGTGKLSDKIFDVSYGFAAFRENVMKTQKPLRA